MTEQLTPSEAEDRLGDAMSAVDEVRRAYPATTDELDELLAVARANLLLVYLRIGREDETPSLKAQKHRLARFQGGVRGD